MPAPTLTVHDAVDRIIRRQQGRLLGQLRDKGTLTREIESVVSVSFGWTGQDIHKAISGEFQEAENARIRRH
ncbi:MAG TPA: hypothetical protein PL016_06040 [Kiritimatiellia bacterium]|nr:hypothetical protein [Kiritimatiellia bacterium]